MHIHSEEQKLIIYCWSSRNNKLHLKCVSSSETSMDTIPRWQPHIDDNNILLPFSRFLWEGIPEVSPDLIVPLGWKIYQKIYIKILTVITSWTLSAWFLSSIIVTCLSISLFPSRCSSRTWDLSWIISLKDTFSWTSHYLPSLDPPWGSLHRPGLEPLQFHVSIYTQHDTHPVNSDSASIPSPVAQCVVLLVGSHL